MPPGGLQQGLWVAARGPRPVPRRDSVKPCEPAYRGALMALTKPVRSPQSEMRKTGVSGTPSSLLLWGGGEGGGGTGPGAVPRNALVSLPLLWVFLQALGWGQAGGQDKHCPHPSLHPSPSHPSSQPVSSPSAPSASPPCPPQARTGHQCCSRDLSSRLPRGPGRKAGGSRSAQSRAGEGVGGVGSGAAEWGGALGGRVRFGQ